MGFKPIAVFVLVSFMLCVNLPAKPEHEKNSYRYCINLNI